MKAYWKYVFKTIVSKRIRLLMMFSILAVGISLSTGLGTVPEQLKSSFNTYFDQSHPDIILHDSKENAIDIEMIRTVEGIQNVYALFKEETTTTISYYLDFERNPLEKMVWEGALPQSQSEVMIEKPRSQTDTYKIGDWLDHQGLKVKIVGFVYNPMYTIKTHEGDGQKMRVLYFNHMFKSTQLEKEFLIYTTDNPFIFSDAYDAHIAHIISKIQESISLDTLSYLTYQTMLSPITVSSYIDKMDRIRFVFPIFFMLIITIVGITMIQRMIEEQRFTDGTLMTIGYSKKRIAYKYYIFVTIACIIGALIGITFGYQALAKQIYEAFGAVFIMPHVDMSLHIGFGLLVSGLFFMIMTICVTVLIYAELKEVPVALLKTKAPKLGKKIILERIKWLWRPLKFSYKSTLRNIFRYPLHFLMTWLSVAGSTLLVFAGFGLYDNTRVLQDDSVQSIRLVAIIVLISAATLSIIVTYNLTHMNIEKRTKEIATLKVLGYTESEVRFYIYREIAIVSIIAIVMSLPVSYYVLKFVLDYIQFGSMDQVTIITWVMTVFCSLFFILITDVLLVSKMRKIDMVTSLKSVE